MKDRISKHWARFKSSLLESELLIADHEGEIVFDYLIKESFDHFW